MPQKIRIADCKLVVEVVLKLEGAGFVLPHGITRDSFRRSTGYWTISYGVFLAFNSRYWDTVPARFTTTVSGQEQEIVKVELLERFQQVMLPYLAVPN